MSLDDDDSWPGVWDDDVPLPALGEAAISARHVSMAVIGTPTVAADEDLAIALTLAQSVLKVLNSFLKCFYFESILLQGGTFEPSK